MIISKKVFMPFFVATLCATSPTASLASSATAISQLMHTGGNVSLDQDHLINQIAAFLRKDLEAHQGGLTHEEISKRKEDISYFEKSQGQCYGLSALWVSSKRAEDDTQKSGGKSHKLHDFSTSYKDLAGWDGQTPFTPGDSSRLHTFIQDVMTQQASQRLKGKFGNKVNGHDFAKSYSDPELGSPTLNFQADNIVLSKTMLKSRLEKVIHPGSMVFLTVTSPHYSEAFQSTMGHVVAAYQSTLDGKISFYNSSNSSGAKEAGNIDELVDLYWAATDPNTIYGQWGNDFFSAFKRDPNFFGEPLRRLGIQAYGFKGDAKIDYPSAVALGTLTPEDFLEALKGQSTLNALMCCSNDGLEFFKQLSETQLAGLLRTEDLDSARDTLLVTALLRDTWPEELKAAFNLPKNKDCLENLSQESLFTTEHINGRAQLFLDGKEPTPVKKLKARSLPSLDDVKGDIDSLEEGKTWKMNGITWTVKRKSNGYGDGDVRLQVFLDYAHKANGNLELTYQINGDTYDNSFYLSLSAQGCKIDDETLKSEREVCRIGSYQLFSNIESYAPISVYLSTEEDSDDRSEEAGPAAGKAAATYEYKPEEHSESDDYAGAAANYQPRAYEYEPRAYAEPAATYGYGSSEDYAGGAASYPAATYAEPAGTYGYGSSEDYAGAAVTSNTYSEDKPTFIPSLEAMQDYIWHLPSLEGSWVHKGISWTVIHQVENDADVAGDLDRVSALVFYSEPRDTGLTGLIDARYVVSGQSFKLEAQGWSTRGEILEDPSHKGYPSGSMLSFSNKDRFADVRGEDKRRDPSMVPLHPFTPKMPTDTFED